MDHIGNLHAEQKADQDDRLCLEVLRSLDL